MDESILKKMGFEVHEEKEEKNFNFDREMSSNSFQV
jgi:hypothetical protein